MFKKNQLVKSKISGRIVEVLSWPTVRAVNTRAVERCTHNAWTLIGNNYQPKPNTPAR